jgi:signal transduction histidine kinase
MFSFTFFFKSTKSHFKTISITYLFYVFIFISSTKYVFVLIVLSLLFQNSNQKLPSNVVWEKKKFMVIQRINNIFFNALFFFHGIYPNTIFFFTDLTFELIISLRNVTLHLTLLVWDTCIDKSFLKSLENKMWNLEKIQERGKKRKEKKHISLIFR